MICAYSGGNFIRRDAALVGGGFAGLVVALKIVALAAQRPAGNLFAEQLRAEFADAADVRDGVGVPAFGEHRDGDDAADVRAKGVAFADGVDHFAQDGRILDALGGALSMDAGIFLLKAL